MSVPNPFLPFVEHQGVVVLDGGLATSLERAGEDLNDPLWSAKALIDAPDTIRRVHDSFLDSGADCITSATYQATIPGFHAKGLDREESLALLDTGVQLALQARNEFWSRTESGASRLRPIVAASVGPYGAYLANGSEYRGDYGSQVDFDWLCRFHEPRWTLFAKSDADIVACETIPSGVEVEALLKLVSRTPTIAAWISLSCRDGETMADGTPVQDVARACDRVPGVVAVGVNCLPPSRVSTVLDTLAQATSKYRLAYPNSGELFDATDKSWYSSAARPSDWVEQAQTWLAQGARGIGGCCRTTPADIARLRRTLLDAD